jgi:hypothetical protein
VALDASTVWSGGWRVRYAWVEYLLWSVVTGMLAGIGVAEQQIPAYVAEFFAAFCMWYHRTKAARLVNE